MHEAAAVGPFFGVRTDAAPGPGGPRAEGYVPLGEAYRTTDGTAAQPLLDRIDAVAASLGTGERRVAASLVFQGLAARLWSIALGPAALSGHVPDLRPDTLWWNPARTAPHDLWLPGPARVLGEPGGLAGQLGHAVYVNLLPLHRATRTACRISEALLWGNAAAALAGSLRVLCGWCHAQGRPEAARQAVVLARALLAAPPLENTGTWHLGPERDFRRRSCCLYYRVPGGGLCGDCALRSRPPGPGRRPAPPGQ
ncbi:(2Fe-2S)-binding protein [Streptomyces sp. P1-3]|uniref:(2Fe-2S)-binding protein n=1 Tax=Streptomyces sp. P1-3 TaxID=3421658 RepID=UPI003D35CCF7